MTGDPGDPGQGIRHPGPEDPRGEDRGSRIEGGGARMDAEARVARALVEAATSGRRVALATVVGARGSTPRGVGSKMVVDPAVGLVGTIGGGCGEADVIEAAGAVLETGRPRRVRVELTDPEESWSPAVCGGVMDVFVEPVFPDVD